MMSILFDASIKGSVLLALAWAITRIFRNASAAAKHLVWCAALCGMVMIPILSTVVPRIPVNVLRPIAMPALPRGSAFASTPAPRADTAVRPIVAPRARAIDIAPAPTSSDIVRFIPAIWLAIAALVLLRTALGVLRVALWARNAYPVADGAWLSLAQRITLQLDIARPVILLRSERACVPMTWGVVYPTVLLPVDADDWTAERRTIVLLHELAHVKRLDAFTQYLAQLVVALFWFNPLVWLAARQMRMEREHACDDFVLEGGARATDYAYDLLQIARSLGGGSTPAAALAMARRSELEGRLLAILDPHTNHRGVSRARLALAMAGVLALSIPLAAFAPVTSKVDLAPRVQRGAADAWVNDASPASTPVAIARASIDLPSTMIAPRAAPLPPVSKPIATSPDRETLIAVAKAATKLTSDYEKAELLLTIAKYYVQDDELCTTYLDVVSSMASDYDRARTLLPLLATEGLPASSVAKVVKVASTMTSDNDKATLFTRVMTGQNVVSSSTRDALIVAVGTLTSDYSRGQTIAAIAKHGDLTKKQTIELIGVTSTMAGSYEKANALVAIAAHQSMADAEVRGAFLKAAETITAAGDYRRVVSTILK
jgi:beta-lactamase regulating signal transducer with metallopeptidase domain